MTTIRDITTAALRRINVVDIGEEPDADEAADALERLNDLMASWESRNWIVTTDADGTAYTHATLTLNNDWPLEEKHVWSIKAVLSRLLCEAYGTPIGAQLQEDSNKGENLLRGAFFCRPKASIPNHLLRRPGRYYDYG